MAHILPLKQAIQEMVRNGDIVALEGFTHLISSRDARPNSPLHRGKS
ncbi:MAG TPA: hypothetical protein VME17_12895 [Bryobacteraceae bacterium]|nr:hypothetical protein [Bryobacteraceae bacterium]